MTNDILQFINQKNRLYIILMHTDTDNTDLFNRHKDEYKQYRVYLHKQLEKQNVNIMITYFLHTKMI